MAENLAEKSVPSAVLLNGPSSSGKSSIARALQKKLGSLGIASAVVSIDYMTVSQNEEIWEDDVFEIMPSLCAGLKETLSQGKFAVIDHVITSERIYRALTDALSGRSLKTVRVSCSLELLKRREAERKDRFIGSAEASYQYLYPKDGYDLTIDSGTVSPDEAAERILRVL